MRDFLASTRRCATCQWWEGERVADSLEGRVELPRHAGMGYCRSPSSWWLGRPRQADSLCRFWEQWERVRGLGMDRALGRRYAWARDAASTLKNSRKHDATSRRVHLPCSAHRPVHFRYNPETGKPMRFRARRSRKRSFRSR
jgi:hypothetical protein